MPVKVMFWGTAAQEVLLAEDSVTPAALDAHAECRPEGKGVYSSPGF